MNCPYNENKEFYEENCKTCSFYFMCYNANKTGNAFGKEDEIIGDNFPIIGDDSFISKEEIEKFKKGLEDIIYFEELPKI